ncbi:uncharacterized protein LOC141901949 [Tubulanus polymorphus]|uniref:uncharacterized protein LOC141901949 n=1 Tax=Tubulanus polymorphus TaxID=672921 RepID=UPI003DA5D0DF
MDFQWSILRNADSNVEKNVDIFMMDLNSSGPHFLEELIIIVVLCIIGALLIFIIIYCIKKRWSERNTLSQTDDTTSPDRVGHHVAFEPPPSYVEVMTTDRYPTPEFVRTHLPNYLSSTSIHSSFYSSCHSMHMISPLAEGVEQTPPPSYEDATKTIDEHSVIPT